MFSRKKSPDTNFRPALEKQLKLSPSVAIDEVIATMEQNQKALESLIVRGFYHLGESGPSMSGHTLTDGYFPSSAQKELRTLQAGFYTRYGGGAAILLFGRNADGNECVVMQINKRRKIKHYEPTAMGYGNPAPLQPINQTPLVIDYDKHHQSTEALDKKVIDTCFEEQLRGRSLLNALEGAYKKKGERAALTTETYHPTLFDVVISELQEETGITPDKINIYELPGGIQSRFKPGWNLTLITQSFWATWKEGTLPQSYRPEDVDEVVAIDNIPLVDIQKLPDGSGLYQATPIPKNIMDYLRKALTAYRDRQITHKTQQRITSLQSACKLLRINDASFDKLLFDELAFKELTEALMKSLQAFMVETEPMRFLSSKPKLHQHEVENPTKQQDTEEVETPTP